MLSNFWNNYAFDNNKSVAENNYNWRTRAVPLTCNSLNFSTQGKRIKLFITIAIVMLYAPSWSREGRNPRKIQKVLVVNPLRCVPLLQQPLSCVRCKIDMNKFDGTSRHSTAPGGHPHMTPCSYCFNMNGGCIICIAEMDLGTATKARSTKAVMYGRAFFMLLRDQHRNVTWWRAHRYVTNDVSCWKRHCLHGQYPP